MKIILYTIHCPKCTVLEKKLQSANIEFEIIDDEDQVVNFGREHKINSAPLLAVDDQVYDFNGALGWLRG